MDLDPATAQRPERPERSERSEQTHARGEQRLPGLVAGRLCLDFANTVEPRGGRGPAEPGARDYLPDYPALVAWAVHADVLDTDQAARLLHAARRDPRQAGAVHTRALALREAVYRVFVALAHQQPVAPADLRVLEAEHAAAAATATLTATSGGFGWTWRTDDALDRVLWPVTRCAVDLLTTGDPTRLKTCPGVPGKPPACAWVFYDTSRNRSRSWCSMSTPDAASHACGGVSKARRQTQRRRSARRGPTVETAAP